MKSLLFLGLVFFSIKSYASQELNSKDIKTKICNSLKYEISDLDETIKFNQSLCLKSKMTITTTSRDPRINEVTLMSIKYDMNLGKVKVSGDAVVITNFTPGTNGELQKTWAVRSTKSTLSDTRNIVEMIKEEIQVGDYDYGNGDLFIENKPGYGLREARKDLTKRLQNGSCKYVTFSGIESTLRDWAFDRMVSQKKLGSLLKMANDQGKIKAAVHRIYDDGESEYCSHYYYIFIFSDSTVLNILIDQTT